jgi:hypothetical protein
VNQGASPAKELKAYVILVLLGALILTACRSPNLTIHPAGLPVRYEKAAYGLTFFLAESWRGYSVSVQQLEDTTYSSADDEQIAVGHTPLVVIRRSQSETGVSYQEIPILAFTRAQWDAFHRGELWSSLYAGGTFDELWHNQKYVFAMSSRYNTAERLHGRKEVATIIEQNRAANNMTPLYPE